MKNINIAILFFATIIMFSSCEKVVDLDLDDTSNELVVEANVTNQAGPHYVKLTKSIPFDESSIYPEVNNALVVISDDFGQVDTLTYTANGIYQTSTLQGIEDRTYFLKIELDGKTYTASSKMPKNVMLENLRASVLPFAGTDRNIIFPVYTDPIYKGNNYNFKIFINGKQTQTYTLWNDNTNNGLPNQRPVGGPDLELVSGDNMIVEMQCVDEIVYNYFFTLSQMASNGPGGGTTPTNPPNNISGGALGLFSAYAVSAKSITIP